MADTTTPEWAELAHAAFAAMCSGIPRAASACLTVIEETLSAEVFPEVISAWIDMAESVMPPPSEDGVRLALQDAATAALVEVDVVERAQRLAAWLFAARRAGDSCTEAILLASATDPADQGALVVAVLQLCVATWARHRQVTPDERDKRITALEQALVLRNGTIEQLRRRLREKPSAAYTWRGRDVLMVRPHPSEPMAYVEAARTGHRFWVDSCELTEVPVDEPLATDPVPYAPTAPGAEQEVATWPTSS
ncbi:hypothetical protein [Allokutzneria albata]|uniref:Uncharacterized protein n=1 Tax=Allokutzneria albata TaxID=211114 RepID=A0A1H0DTC3_ALLAB|nr:hypothetical protein [Allokutzneria albata]SDN73283.1 hypothetical protein SAMN04489726_7980 [Allokutzneria albata]